jgi:hypothetical protein
MSVASIRFQISISSSGMWWGSSLRIIRRRSIACKTVVAYICGMTYPKIIVFFLSILAINSNYAQTDCNCKTSLENLIRKIETEYPGFEEKVKNDKPFYDNRKETLLNKNNTVINDSCINVLQDYINFFKDEHIFLQVRAKATPQQEG